MSDENENKNSREEATEALFTFSDGDEVRKDKAVDDELSRVNYEEELALQNVFLDKDENTVNDDAPAREAGQVEPSVVADPDARAATGAASDAAAAAGTTQAGNRDETASNAAQDAATPENDAIRSSVLNIRQYEDTPDTAANGAAATQGTDNPGPNVPTPGAIEPEPGIFNHAPVAGPDVEKTVSEGADVIAGQLTAVDADPGDALSFFLGEGVEPPAGFTLNDDGSYTFDPSVGAYEHLNVGDSVVLTIPVTVTDPHGAVDVSQITITVTGTNDAPVAGADIFRSVDEGGRVISGQMTSTDADDNATAVFAVAEGVATPDGFVLGDNGEFSFDPADPAYDSLSVGDAITLTVPVTITDDQGATDTSLIQITVNGTNDAPVAGAAVFATVFEDANAISGQLTSTDADAVATATFSISEGVQAPPGFVLHADGSYSFDPGAEAYDHLNVGDSTVITIPVIVTDDQGATDSSQIQITVLGTNDAPVASAAVTAEVLEGGNVIGGALTFTDADDDASATFAISAGADTPAGFVLNADGTYSFDPADTAYDHLNVGDSSVITVPVTVTDEQGGTDTSQIQITVVGTNDAPVAGADVAASVAEGDATIGGQLTSTDLDDGATATFTVSEGAEAPAGFVLNEDGSYSFDPSDEAYDHLNVGDSSVLTIPVTVTDDQGATDTSQIQITVHGTNDAPVAGADVTTSIEEGAAVISGQLTATDLDDGATAAFSLSEGVEAPAGFVLNEDGSYSFDPSDEAYDTLAVGDAAVLTVPVTVTDDQGATDTSQIQITVQGTNDAPVAGADVFAKVEEGASVISGQLTATDVDDGATATFSVAENADVPAGFVMNEDGSYAFDPTDDAYNHLAVGDSTVLTIPVTVTDDQGATDTSQIEITVTGTNDAPVAGANIAMQVDEGEAAVTGQLTATDLDDGATASFALAEGVDAPAGFVLNDDGSYAFDPTDDAYNHLAAGDSTVLTIPVTVTDDQGATDSTQIQITVNGTNDGPTADDDIGRIWVSETSNEVVDNMQIGTFGSDRADVSDWGELTDGKAVFSEGDITVTTSVSEGNLTAYNKQGHVGFGIGNQDRDGLDRSETLTVDIEGGDANRVEFTLSGLGNWFDESNKNATEVKITAYDQDGQVIETQGGYRESGNYEDTYSFETDTPVSRFEITSEGGNGTFVVKNMTLSATDTIDLPGHWENVTEDGSITIDVLKNDTDVDGDTLTIVGVESPVMIDGVEVGLAEIVETENGPQIQFTPGEAMDALAEGDSQQVSFEYTISDGQGGTDTASVKLTVDGVNDGPVAGPTVTVTVEEGAADISGQLTSSDLDDGATATFSISEGIDAPAGFVLNDDGSYSFDPADEAYDQLDAGDSMVLTIPVTVTDDQGATDTSQIQITVSGTNDAPVAGADVSAKVAEGDTAFGGQLTATDLDEGATAAFSVSEGAETPAGFVLNDDGSYSFDPADEAYEHLSAGDSTVLTIPVTVTDDQGATDTSQIQITVTGTNDAPVAGADVTAKAAEGDTAFGGQLTATDLDEGATATFTVSDGADVPAGFVLNEDGSYHFDPAEEAYDHLSVGDAVVLTIPITVTDDQGATDTSQIQITVTGTNDAPVAGADVTAKVAEGDAAIGGKLSATDADDGASVSFTVTEGAETPAGFVLNEDGSYSFDPADEAYDNLGAGDSAVLTIPVTVTDDQGATDTSQIQITVTGTNDAPVAGADVTAKVAEGDAAIGGKLSATDADDGASVSFTVTEGAETPAGFVLNEDGSYSFDPADEAYDNLGAGDSAVLTIPVTVTDDQGATDTSQIQITVTGTNDAPVAGATVAAKVEEGDSAIQGQVTATDVDEGSSVTFSVAEGAEVPDGFSLGDDGSFSFDPADAAYDNLAPGESTVLTVPVTVTDDQGATDTTQVQITVTGTNDAPVAGVDVFHDIDEGAGALEGQVTATDMDDGATLTFSLSEGAEAPAGFSLSEDGSYSFDPSDEAYDHLNVGDSVTLNVPVTVADEHGGTDTSQVQITVTGTNDAPVASDQKISTEEGTGVITGELPAVDVDDGAQLTFSAEGDLPPGFTLHEDGSYEFDTSDAAFDGYAEGEHHAHAVNFTVTDEHGASSSGTLYVGVEGSNDTVSMVVDTNPGDNSIAEDAIAGTPVGLVAGANDADGDAVHYSIVDSDGNAVTDGAFAVDADTGVVTVNDPEQIDYETADSHDITIQATSADGSTSQQSFTVGVTDVNENTGPEAGDDIGRIWVSETTNEVVENLEIGTFGDDRVDVTDWGDLVDGKAVFTEGDITVTTSVSEGSLKAYNKEGHVGFGIGNQDRSGLDRTETLTIDIEGGDANRVDFTLSGLGDWFDEDSKHATEVKITAYDHDGNMIETQGGYRESGSYEDTYSFETETPVSRFEITSEGSMGTFVVKNMTLSATDTIDIPGHWENVSEDGSITIDVLKNDTDADGDALTIVGVESPVIIDGVEVGHAEIVETEDGQQIQFTPGDAMDALAEGESQDVSFEYKVSDGQGGTDTATVKLTVEGENDAPEIEATNTEVTENTAQVIGSVNDIDGEIDSSSLSAEHGSVELDQDGNILYKPEADYEGTDVVNVSVTDDSGATTTQSINLTVDPASDSPVTTDGNDAVRGTDGDDKISGLDGDDKIAAMDGDDVVSGDAGNDLIDGGAGDDTLSGGADKDETWGGDGNDLYIMELGDGSDYFHGGNGGGWTDTIQLSASPEDGDSPWTIEVNGEQVEYDLAAGALELQPDTQGVIKLADGSELAFDGVESIQW